jgi:hypothetical protein
MKKIWILILGLLMVYVLILNFVKNDDLSEKMGLPVNNWIIRILIFGSSLGCFWEYYSANWKKSKNQ